MAFSKIDDKKRDTERSRRNGPGRLCPEERHFRLTENTVKYY